MDRQTDLYRDWLQIPDGPRPPDHYALLGLERGESDLMKIQAAADERMRIVRPRTLKFRETATRLLNEIAQARVCLTDPEEKAAYDHELSVAGNDPTKLLRLHARFGYVAEATGRVKPSNAEPGTSDAAPIPAVPQVSGIPGPKPSANESAAAIEFHCPTCGALVRAPALSTGRKSRCPKCRTLVIVPNPDRTANSPPDMRPAPAAFPTIDEPVPSDSHFPAAPSPEAQVAPDFADFVAGLGSPQPVREAPRVVGGQTPGATYSGGPIPSDWDFFVPAPEEIGYPLSGFTSLKRGTQPIPLGVRIFQSALAGVVVAGIVWFAIRHFQRDSSAAPNVGPVVGCAVGLFVFVLALCGTVFSHTCSYVGEAGIMCASLRKSRASVPKVRTLVYAAAGELRVRVVDIHKKGGAYDRTEFSFEWTSENGRELFAIRGTSTTRSDDPELAFGRAAESQWNNHFMGRIPRLLATEGAVRFTTRTLGFLGIQPMTISVGPGILMIGKPGSMVRLTSDEIKMINVRGGVLTIKHRDARWYGKGVYRMNVTELGNATILFALFEPLLGRRPTSEQLFL